MPNTLLEVNACMAVNAYNYNNITDWILPRPSNALLLYILVSDGGGSAAQWLGRLPCIAGILGSRHVLTTG